MEARAALRQARRHAALSQRALAARAGVSQSVVARIESGRVEPTLESLKRLLSCCGLRLAGTLVPDGEPESAASRHEARLAAQEVRVRLQRGIRAGQFVASRAVWERLADQPMTQRAVRAACRDARLMEQWRLRREADRLRHLEESIARDAAAGSARERADRRAAALDHLTRWPLRDRLGDRAVAVALAVAPVARVILVGGSARTVWDPTSSPVRRSARLSAGRAGPGQRPPPGQPAAPGPRRAREVVEIAVDPAGENEAYRVLATAGLLTGTRLVPGFRWLWPGAAPVGTGHWRDRVRVARPEQLPEAPWSTAATSVLLSATARDRRGRQRPPTVDLVAGTLA